MPVTYTIECLEEHEPVRGNLIASGSDSYDREQEDKVIARLERGDLWAWCCVKMTASLDGFTGSDYLGCCSYSHQKAFEACGYFEDMKRAALEDLRRNLQETATEGVRAQLLLSENIP